jgi:hypothetical protein
MSFRHSKLLLVEITSALCVLLLATFVATAAYSQSVKPAGSRPRTFHVEGTIRRGDSGVAGVEVKFEGKNTTKTAFSNPSGFYKAELPVGFYTMTASLKALEEYRRRFLVASRSSIALDVLLYDYPDNCDPLFGRVVHSDGTPISPEPTQDDYNDVCGGSDFVSVPSEDGSPFELFIRYSSRRRSDFESTYTYGIRGPVSVAYNLFTLSADKVVYNSKNRTVIASGGVVTYDASGKKKWFDSATFRIANGQVSALIKEPYGGWLHRGAEPCVQQ